MISRSVPHTPSARVRTRTAPSESGGSGMSSSLAEFATPGETVIARIAFLTAREASPRRPNELLCRQAAKSSSGSGNENESADFNTFNLQEGTHGPDWTQAVGNPGRIHSIPEFLFRPHPDFP